MAERLFWMDKELRHVEAEMRKEFPHLDPGVISLAVRGSELQVNPAEGLVEFLRHVRQALSKRDA